jgi:hypothetical protein
MVTAFFGQNGHHQVLKSRGGNCCYFADTARYERCNEEQEGAGYTKHNTSAHQRDHTYNSRKIAEFKS